MREEEVAITINRARPYAIFGAALLVSFLSACSAGSGSPIWSAGWSFWAGRPTEPGESSQNLVRLATVDLQSRCRAVDGVKYDLSTERGPHLTHCLNR